MNQTAIEWLYEKLEYVNWMRNRDEISSGMADEWRKHYLEQAKAMEKEYLERFYYQGYIQCSIEDLKPTSRDRYEDAEDYYNKFFKSK